MANSIFSDDAFRSAKIALDGLALRQQMIGRISLECGYTRLPRANSEL